MASDPEPRISQGARSVQESFGGIGENLDRQFCLEIHTQAELEAAGICSAGDLTEVAGTESGANAEPGEVVRGVVELAAELHGELFAEAEVLLQGGIPIVGAFATDDEGGRTYVWKMERDDKWVENYSIFENAQPTRSLILFQSRLPEIRLGGG